MERIKNMSILSKEMDGAGYYYGWYKQRFINVKWQEPYWVGYVDDFVITGTARTKQQAERECKEYVDYMLTYTDKGRARLATWVMLIAIVLIVVLAPLMFR